MDNELIEALLVFVAMHDERVNQVMPQVEFQHYVHGSSTGSWLREMIAIETEEAA